MARGRSWDALSAAYRGRLSRKGITRESYESGVSLSAARGHAKTPEHPQEAMKHPQKYAEYNRKKHRNAKERLARLKSKYFQDDFKYNEKRSKSNLTSVVTVSNVTIKATTEQMEEALTMSEDDMRDAARQAALGRLEQWSFLWYH